MEPATDTQEEKTKNSAAFLEHDRPVKKQTNIRMSDIKHDTSNTR